MKLRIDQRMMDAEIVIFATIKLDVEGNVENKEEIKKCPLCKEGSGKVCYSRFEENGESELRYHCGRCSGRWAFRYKNPLFFIEL